MNLKLKALPMEPFAPPRSSLLLQASSAAMYAADETFKDSYVEWRGNWRVTPYSNSKSQAGRAWLAAQGVPADSPRAADPTAEESAGWLAPNEAR